LAIQHIKASKFSKAADRALNTLDESNKIALLHYLQTHCHVDIYSDDISADALEVALRSIVGEYASVIMKYISEELKKMEK
jgi:hypothetical protein